MPRSRIFDIGSHTVAIVGDHIVIKPKSNDHMVIVGAPDSSVVPDGFFETEVYVANHASLLIRGEHKGTVRMCIQSDEYPTELAIDNADKGFTQTTLDEIIGRIKNGMDGRDCKA